MTKRTLLFCAAVLFSGAGLYGACDDTLTGTNCAVTCEDVDRTCVSKCNDDTCKTACTTDLDNCKASCGMVTATPPDGG